MPTMTSNLQPGQYRLDNDGIIFGAGTQFEVNTFDPQPYNINAQDAQVNRSDETLMGFDTHAAQPIQLEGIIRDFHALPRMVPFTGVTLDPSFDLIGQNSVEEFQHAWNAQDARRSFNQLVGLQCCGRDGKTRIAYGRPRKIHVSKKTRRSPAFTWQAEFARSDTLYYDYDVQARVLVGGNTPTIIHRTNGRAPSWFRILLIGPITHPIVTIGEQQVELDVEIDDGDIVEVSSYPWKRRIINNYGMNLGAKLVGDTQYLDQLTIPANVDVPVRWTAEELNTWVPTLEAQRWVEQIEDVGWFKIPSTFTTIHGRAAVRTDFFNPILWTGRIRKYISAAMFADRTAIIYNAKRFGTNNQYCEATVVEPFAGKSGIAIMSNATMTNFAILVASSGFGANWLRIYSGTNYNALTAQSAQWSKPGGWSETDKIGIGYDPATNKFEAYVNGTKIGAGCEWQDTGNVVNKSSTNRSQGFIFDIDGNLFTTGMGFADILAYDRTVTLASVGEVIIEWRDAYHSLP